MWRIETYGFEGFNGLVSSPRSKKIVWHYFRSTPRDRSRSNMFHVWPSYVTVMLSQVEEDQEDTVWNVLEDQSQKDLNFYVYRETQKSRVISLLVFLHRRSSVQYCNTFPFSSSSHSDHCEGPMFPTSIGLYNGTSVVTLTVYTSRCVKHNLEIDWGFTWVISLPLYSTLPPFSWLMI